MDSVNESPERPYPLVVHDEAHAIREDMIWEDARRVMSRLRSHGYQTYIAGGAVRDLLLGRRPKDFDIATDAHPEEVRRLFRNCRLIGRRFRLAHVLFGDRVIEVSTFRARIDVGEQPDIETASGRPAFKARDGLILRDNVYGDAEQDAWRRDFTVNALFCDGGDLSIIDYVGGMADLNARLMRCIGDPAVRYTEDPVRMIRAVRFAAALDFTLEPATYQGILDRREHLANASSFRLFDEIQKLFFCGRAVRVYELLDETGLFDVMFPELGNWVRERPEQKAWVQRVMRQVDIWRGAGMPVHPELLLALLFGPYHEHLAQDAIAQGAPPVPALEMVTREHMLRLGDRICVPRPVIRHVSDIMGVQVKMRNPPIRALDRFQERPVFMDALIYFKLYARHHGEHAQALEWWEQNK